MQMHKKIYKCKDIVNTGCPMKKLYNFRIETTLIKQIDKLDGNRTENITNALQMYLQPDTQNIYNVNLVDLLKDQITDLKQDKIYLQNQVNALMVTKMPLLQRVIEKLRG